MKIKAFFILLFCLFIFDTAKAGNQTKTEETKTAAGVVIILSTSDYEQSGSREVLSSNGSRENLKGAIKSMLRQ